MKKGSITIYMSLVLAVMLSLFLTVIEGARNKAVMVQATCAFDLAVTSVFAEYNRALFEKYDLFFIDTSYGEAGFSMERTKNHLDYYINENLSEGNEKKTITADFTKTFLENSSIESVCYATDEQGLVFQRQAIEYMKQKYGISYIEDLKKELEEADKNEILTRDVTAQRNANQTVIDQTEIPQKETGEIDADGNPVQEEVELENPADSVNGSRAKGILMLVTEKEKPLSGQEIDQTQYISHRGSSTKGDGLAGREKPSMAENLLFDAYIMDTCGNYLHPGENGALQYQVEYILGGKNNDIDNLKWVVHRLLLIREAANVGYLFTDAAKTAEAAALATSVATAAGVPVLIEPIKISLLFAWAYAESVYDVRQLLVGQRIPLMKTAQNWHFSLEGMLNYEADASINESADLTKDGQTDSIKDGLSYEEYLRLLLTVSPREEKVLHMMDVVEMDVRKTAGNRNFRLDGCVDYLVMEASVGSKYGYFRVMERTFYYI